MTTSEQVAIGRVALTRAPASGPDERPSEPDAPRLELPPEEDSAPPTQPARAAVATPSVGNLTPLALPAAAPAAADPGPDEGPRLELPPDPDEVSTLPSLSRASSRPPRPLPDLTEAVTSPAVRPVSRATTEPPEARAPAAPTWLEVPLEARTRWAAAVTGPLSALLFVDLLAAGRWSLASAIVGPQAVLAMACTAALARRSRLAWPLAAALIIALTWSSLRPTIDPWSLATTLTFAFGLATLTWPGAGPGRFVVGVLAGLTSLGLATPECLDGVGPERALGLERARSRRTLGQRLSWPHVDQPSGVQFGPAPAPWFTTPAPGVFVEPQTGATLFAGALAKGLPFDQATLSATSALAGAGVSGVTLGPPTVDEDSPFDASATLPFTGRQGRAAVQGLLRVGETGPEAVVLAAWVRTGRAEAALPALGPLLATMRRDPPARPSFESPQARALADRSVASVVGSSTWAVRVVVGARAAVLVPSSLVQGLSELPLEVGGVTTKLAVGARRVAAGVSVIPSTLAAEAAPLRSFAAAPRLSRVLVRGPGWSGGWLTGEPSAAVRPLDVQTAVSGPAFDVSGALVGVVLEGATGPELVTLDALAPALTEVLGTAPPLSASPAEVPPPLFVARQADEGAGRSLEPRLRENVVLVPTAAGPVAAVVMARKAAGWVLVVPRLANAQAVTVKLGAGPEAVTRAAEVVRQTRDVALLVMEADPLDALNPIVVADARALEGRRLAFGFRGDPATGLPTLRPLPGEVVDSRFEADPGPEVSAGPVVTSDGRWVGLRLPDGVTVVPAASLVELGVAGLRDVVWKVSFEPTGSCQLAATFELEDPLGDATLVAVRLEPGEAPARTDEAPPRLKAARLTDTVPRAGEARLLFTMPCVTGPMQLQFEVSSQGQTRVTWPQTLRPPADLPWVQRGRASGTLGSGPPKTTLAAELWETPARATMKHPCGTAPQLCERACAIDDFDACTFDGRYALATKEYGRAVVVLDGACGRGEVEACVLLEWALSEKRGAKARSRPDAVLRPWCEAGVARACAALDVPGWRRAIGPAKEACVEAPKACRAYAELLLAGARLDADVTRALGALKQACGVSDERACGLLARTVIQLDKQDPVTVMPLLDRACAAGDLASCSLRAMNAGLGLTLPRSAQVANAWLEEACAKGALDACAQVLR
jgi:hypothetical protein